VSYITTDYQLIQPYEVQIVLQLLCVIFLLSKYVHAVLISTQISFSPWEDSCVTEQQLRCHHHKITKAKPTCVDIRTWKRGFYAWPNSTSNKPNDFVTTHKTDRPCTLRLRSSTVPSFVTSLKKHPTVRNSLGTFLKLTTLNPPLQFRVWLSLYITSYTSFESCLVSQLWHYTVGSHLIFKILRQAVSRINLLKPTGYVMHQQVNIQQLYVLPTLYLCVLYLSENKQRLVPLTA
jgi:hypothetical protein